jgi:hypothetical protein
MNFKSFKQFLIEATTLKEAQEIFNAFKVKLESKYKEVNPNFKVLSSGHLFERVIERIANKTELENIFDKIYDRFFKTRFNK